MESVFFFNTVATLSFYVKVVFEQIFEGRRAQVMGISKGRTFPGRKQHVQKS